MGESGSEVSFFILEPRKFEEVTRLSEDISKHWLKATLEDINNLTNNLTSLLNKTENDEPVTPCMEFYKGKINMMEVLTT